MAAGRAGADKLLQVREGGVGRRSKRRGGVAKSLRKHWQLYLLLIPPVLYLIIFKYVPMAGAQIAFKNYNVVKGIWGSDWVGLDHFVRFFNLPNFWIYIFNTLGISLYNLLINFPAPIILALALNEVRSRWFKKTVQMVTYAPYFISTVIMVSILIVALNPNFGVINLLLNKLGFESINFMGVPRLFKTVYVLSETWQLTGYSAIIYIAALAGINPDLYEAAKVDGASRLRKIWHIDLPGILPITVVLLILNVGNMMKIGFEKIFLMQNPLNVMSSEVISTYVYKVGLIGANFSFSAAVGLFNSMINLILLLIVNYASRKLAKTSLW